MEIELILYGFGVILQVWYSESGTDGILLEEYLKLERIPVKLYLHMFSLYGMVKETDGKESRLWTGRKYLDWYGKNMERNRITRGATGTRY